MSKFDKRIKLIESGKKNPSPKELEEAYGYLDYCNNCGSPIRWFDRLIFNVQHSIMGNNHSYWCRETGEGVK